MKRAFPLTTNQVAPMQATHAVIVDHEELTAAATTETIELLSVPAGTVVRGAAVYGMINFDGGATSAGTIQIGDGDDPNRFVDATSFHADSTPIEAVVNGGGGTIPHRYAAADTIDLLFTATGANVSVLTQGKVLVLLDLVLPPHNL